MSTLTLGNVSLDHYVYFFVFMSIVLIIGNVSKNLFRNTLERKFSLRSAKGAATFAQYGIFIIGFYVGFNNILKLNIEALAASLGIISIVIAFSAQQLVQNLIAGLILSLKKLRRLEDWVEIGSSGVGRVTDISLIYTTLRLVSGKQVYVSNSQALSQIITNYSKGGFIEIPIELTISPTTDLGDFEKIVMQIADGHPNVLPKVVGNEKKQALAVMRKHKLTDLFGKKIRLDNLKTRVIYTNILAGKITVSIRIWIRDIKTKDDIVSSFIKELQQKLVKHKIVLV